MKTNPSNLPSAIFFLVLLLAVGVFQAQGAHANTYYVATNGNNNNPGTEAAPFRTIHKGASVLGPGDTLFVKDGVYAEEFYNDIPGGTSWNTPVTIKGYPGHRPTIRPAPGAGRVFTFASANSKYIVVDGFVMDCSNCQYDVVKIEWSGSASNVAHHIRIMNSELMNAPGQGVLTSVGAGHNEFINCDIHDNGHTDFDHGLYLDSAYNLVENCRIYRNAGWGVHIYDGYTNQGAHHNIIRNNLIYDNARLGNRGSGIILGSGANNIAFNNVVWGNNNGIDLYYGPGSCKAYNNTVFGNDRAGVSIAYISNSVVKNNIIFGNGGPPIEHVQSTTSGIVIETNLFVDPLFVNSANNDFRLQSNSPAIDAGGTLTEVATDFNGVSRPQGSGYDIGAYEFSVFQTPSQQAPTTPTNLIILPSVSPCTPTTEICDGKDNDCDGQVDEGCSAQSTRLIQKGDLVYQGHFKVPNGALGSSRFNYGGTALAFNPARNSLYIVGHDWDQATAEISIPSIGGTATVLQSFKDATEGRLRSINPGDPNDQKIGGQMVHNDKLFISAYSYYDASGTQSTSHFSRPPSLSSTGQVLGPYKVGGLYPGFVSGYMTWIPEEWQPSLGGPALTGGCCYAINSLQSSGPAASVFNPDDIGVKNPVPATPVVGYPHSHPTLGPWGAKGPNPVYNMATKVSGIVFPEGTRSVLFFGLTGLGETCYGTGAECNDPAKPYKGAHAYPYSGYVWAYDVNDFIAVKNGQKNMWDIRPYTHFTLEPGSFSGAAYDPAAGTIYLVQSGADANNLPLIHVYKISGS